MVVGRQNWFDGWIGLLTQPCELGHEHEHGEEPDVAVHRKIQRVYKCPAERAMIKKTMGSGPRIRSISMSQTFGVGGWLKYPTWGLMTSYRLIPQPSKTWVLVMSILTV